MASFFGWGSAASRLLSHYEEAVYFLSVAKFSEIPGTHLINLGRIKARVNLEATQWF